jgi:hypothetical protein
VVCLDVDSRFCGKEEFYFVILCMHVCICANNVYMLNLKGKLAYFRIKELKDILSLLGLSKQGKKQVSVLLFLSFFFLQLFVQRFAGFTHF